MHLCATNFNNMRFSIYALLVLFFIIGCSSPVPENQMNLTGNIDGLKKGTLILQKIVDTSLVSIDSLQITGDPNFSFRSIVESPEMYYLYLQRSGLDTEDRIAFFAEPKDININSSLKNFGLDVQITGSENQEKMDEYSVMIKRYTDRNLELIEAVFEAAQAGNDSLTQALKTQQNRLLSGKYLATVNFALNNKDYEVAPYLMLTEAYDINPKYLDTVYRALSPSVKNSKYGQALASFMEKSKETP